jgi:LysM domain
MTSKNISSVGGSSPAPPSTHLNTETVQVGDTLSDIALRLGTTEEELLKANPNLAKGLQAGQELKLPVKSAETPAPKSQLEAPKDVIEKPMSPTLLDQMLKPGTGGQIPGGPVLAGTDFALKSALFVGPGIAAAYGLLNADQSKAFSEVEKTPGYDQLAEYQHMRLRRGFEKLSGDKLKNEVTKLQEKIGTIQTLRTHGAWKDLGTDLQNQIADQVFKSPGTGPQDTADFQKKLDSYQNLKGHNAWKTLDPKQRERIADTIFKGPPKNLAQETADLQKKFDAIQTLSGHNAWKKLDPALQQKVSDQMLKTPVGKLPQETADVQKKFDSIETVVGHNAWKELGPAQQQKVEDQLLKSPVGKLPQETTDIQKRLDAVQTLSGHNAWKELQPEQKQKVSDQLLKLSGDQLKQKTTQLQKEFDSIEKMAQHDAWKTLGPDQKQKFTDPVMTLTGQRLKQHLDQTEKKFDVIKSLTTQPLWGKLVPDDQHKIAGQLIKVSDRNLAQTTDNLKGTIDMIGTMRSNSVDPEKTLDKLLTLETESPTAYKKMSAPFTEAQTQINASANKQKASTDIRDMLNLTLDRGAGDRNRKEFEAKPEIFSRFVKQYAKDPADFDQVRTELKDTPAKLLVHWANPDKVGVEFGGGAAIADAALTKVYRDKNIAAGDHPKFKHALNVLVMNEGRLDNVNAWDSGVFSLGLSQWTTHAGSLAGPLAEFQRTNPQKFQQMLPGVTINGDEVSYNGKSLKATNTRSSSSIVGNLNQSEIVKMSKMLTALGKDPDFQAIELKTAVDEVRQTENYGVGTHSVSDYITSNRNLGHLVDFHANRPAWIPLSFRASVENTAKEFGMTATAPSRQELLAALKDKVEKDPEFKKKFSEAEFNNLKTDAGRATFLEQHLMEGFKEDFIAREGDASHRQGLRDRWTKTDGYYNTH